MARTATWTSLLAQIRQAADIESATDRHPDANLLEYANGSWAELYEQIVDGGGDQYLTSKTFSTASATSDYSFTTIIGASPNFYRAKGLDVDIGGPGPLPMRKFAWEERNFYLYNTGWQYGRPVAYHLVGEGVKLIPTPTGVYTVTLWYFPAPVKMTTGADVIDGVAGWEEYVVVDAAIKCLRKDDRDVSIFMAQKAALLKRIIDSACLRDMAEPDRVADVESPNIGMWWR